MKENVNWHSILGEMFTDQRFRQLNKSNWCWYAEIEGTKVGVVLATQGPKYPSPALNKSDVERLLAGKRSGKLDQAFIVVTRFDAFSNYVFRDFRDAVDFYERELTKQRPRPGKHGDFWILTQFEKVDDSEDEPF
jgi:hypothetical protein